MAFGVGVLIAHDGPPSRLPLGADVMRDVHDGAGRRFV
jgi:hypothetical protein